MQLEKTKIRNVKVSYLKSSKNYEYPLVNPSELNDPSDDNLLPPLQS